MLPRTIQSYGGPFQNEEPIVDPESEMDARFGDRFLEDTAQLTNASGFTWFSFVTTATAATTTVSAANVAVSGFFGSGDAQKPTVEKTATGVYVLTWPTEFDDALSAVANMESVTETQPVVFTFASGLNVLGATNGHARVSAIASNVVTVRVHDDAAPAALSDLGGTATISGYLR